MIQVFLRALSRAFEWTGKEQEFLKPLDGRGVTGIRKKVVEVAWAEKEDKAREVPAGSNTGPWIHKYKLQQDPKPGKGRQWCALFASWCVITAARRRGSLRYEGLSFKERLSAKGFAKTLVKLYGSSWVHTPEPGDLAVYHRGEQVDGRWSWRGHIAIVKDVFGDDYYTIGGNESHRVKVTRRDLNDRRLVGFVRLAQ